MIATDWPSAVALQQSDTLSLYGGACGILEQHVLAQGAMIWRHMDRVLHVSGNTAQFQNKGRHCRHPEIPRRVNDRASEGGSSVSKLTFAAVALVAAVSCPGAASAQLVP
jgi:hypothetical protein